MNKLLPITTLFLEEAQVDCNIYYIKQLFIIKT